MLEPNRIYNMDCLEGMKMLDDNSVDLVVTSPPYNKTFFNGGKRPETAGNSIWKGYMIDYDACDDNMPLDEYEEFISEVLNECYRVLKEGGSIFFNHKPIRYGNRIYHPMRLILKSCLDLYQEIIWDRTNSPNIRSDVFLPNTERLYWIGKGKPKFNKMKLDKEYQKEIWTITPKNDKSHPAPFPERMVENCIEGCCDAGGLVLDPFMGGGTTAVAALKCGCSFIGFEISDKYFELANSRIAEIINEQSYRLW